MEEPGNGLSYAAAGVDIDAGNALVERIKPAAAATSRPGLASAIGGFGGLFDLRAAGFSDPILVAATDGVGTKLKVAIESERLDTVGVDLVAMCVNDLICQGAEPLLFLDYFATGQLDVEAAARVISGVADGCRLAGAALVGGETAEMPGMYAGKDFDLAGFAVGAMERGHQLPRGVKAGDRLIALASSGPHSNGYSLIRQLVSRENLEWDSASPFGNHTLGEGLLAPTRIYVSAVLPILNEHGLRALAHITGGGLTENLPRVLPQGHGAAIDLSAWRLPPVFDWVRRRGGVEDAEMLRTFNCGVGMVIVAQPSASAGIMASLAQAGETAFEIGEVRASSGVVYTGEL